MLNERFGRTFCLIHNNGDILYPVRVRNRDSGVFAFRISPGGSGGNTKEVGVEERDELIVLNRVARDGWAVRVSTLDRKRAGLYKIGQRSIREFKDLR